MSSLLRRGRRAALSVLLLIVCLKIAHANQYKSFRVAVVAGSGTAELESSRDLRMELGQGRLERAEAQSFI